MLLAAIQMNAQQDEPANIKKALHFIEQAAEKGAEVVALPEYFHFMGPDREKYNHSHNLQSSLIQSLQEKAARHRIFLLGGSFLEASDREGVCHNTSPLFGPDGSIRALYRKIHLFDVEIPGRFSFHESKAIAPGTETVTVKTERGHWGMAICYDLRFTELFRKLTLQGAELIFLPSAFALHTGKDHWEPLIRARAIENQVYIVAPNQLGFHSPRFQSLGSSMITDPWGTVLARAPEEETVIFAEFNRARLDKIRKEMPCLQHRVPECYRQSFGE